MAELPLTTADRVLSGLDLYIELSVDESDGAKVLLIDSYQHGGNPLSHRIAIYLEGDFIDSDALLLALHDAAIFTNNQLYDAWNNHKLPTPDWL